MYTNVAHYGGDAHIWTPEDAQRLVDEGPHETSAASLCEHHAVTEASDLFHVSDVAPDWRSFLQEDMVCSECAEAWRELVGEADPYALDDEDRERLEQEVGTPSYAAFVEYGEDGEDPSPPAHPNCRASTAEVTVDNDLQTAQDVRGQAEQRLRAGTVEHEVNIDVSLDEDQAKRLAEWMADRAAGDRP